MVKIDIIEGKDFQFNINIESGNEKQLTAVKEIIARVRAEGDQALLDYSQAFDGVSLDSVRVPESEIELAYQLLDPEMIQIIREARDNIRDFHEKQLEKSWFTTKDDGTMLGQKVTPLDRVGVYVPGGTAAYPSSVLMNVMPARIAGVPEIALCTPPAKPAPAGLAAGLGSHSASPGPSTSVPPAILVAANESGIKEIYRVGGAQAIAALAYGTQSIPRVDKITGPGNIYVAMAKREVFGLVDIDMIAGPSEILVACDESADPSLVAADMLSQAEHDPMAASYAVVTSRGQAQAIQAQLENQLACLPRQEIARQAIEGQGKIIIAQSRQEMLDIINKIAPEHLEMMVADPFSYLGGIRHAGAIFLGEYSSEPIGDYFAGPNHVLPTSGTARFSSPLSVDDFIKKSSVIYYSEAAIRQHGDKIAKFAQTEGLDAHAQAVLLRLEKIKKG